MHLAVYKLEYLIMLLSFRAIQKIRFPVLCPVSRFSFLWRLFPPGQRGPNTTWGLYWNLWRTFKLKAALEKATIENWFQTSPLFGMVGLSYILLSSCSKYWFICWISGGMTSPFKNILVYIILNEWIEEELSFFNLIVQHILMVEWLSICNGYYQFF